MTEKKSIKPVSPATMVTSRLISVVVPVYNEEDVLSEFQKRLAAVLDNVDGSAEILYINDGSTDNSLKLMETLRESDPRIGIVDLSRNFGKEIAMSAGIDLANGEAVVVIDADLQDPPEMIPEFMKYWNEGYDVVYAKRSAREGETVLKKMTARAFYRVMKKVSRVTIPEDTGDYRLLSRRAVDALRKLREHHRFMKGLFAWIGYPQKAIPYRRDRRYAGHTKWNYWKLWNFAIEGITSFTTAPLKVSTYLGIGTALCAFVYALWVIIKTLLFGEPVRGYPTLLVVILLIGGVQLVTIGILGEYLGRMFDESKQRPLYLIKEYQPSGMTGRRDDEKL